MRAAPVDFIPKQRPRRRRPRSVSPPPPVSVAPVLVAASFDTSDGAVLTLTFDRAVSVAGVVPSAVIVVDQPGESRYDAGGGAFVIAPGVVRVEMVFVEVVPAGASVLLSATGATGIVAADGGASWGGVTDLALPWP